MILQWTVRLRWLDMIRGGGCGPSGPRSNWASHQNSAPLCSLVTLRLIVNNTFTGVRTRLMSQAGSFWGWQSVTRVAPDAQKHILERRLEEQRCLAKSAGFKAIKNIYSTLIHCCLTCILGQVSGKSLTSPLSCGLKIWLSWYQRTARFLTGATFVILHCSWNSLSSSTALALPTWLMEMLSGSSESLFKEVHFLRAGNELLISNFKNDNQVFMVGAHTKQINKTYCRQWFWVVSDILLNRVGVLLHNRALGRSCCRYGQTKSGHQFCFLAGPASISPYRCLWMYFCMLLAGPYFGIVPPSCLELFR